MRGGTPVCGLRALGWSGLGLHFAAGGAEFVGERGDGPAGPGSVVLRGGHARRCAIGGGGGWEDGVGEGVCVFAGSLDEDVEAFVGLVADESN